MSKRRQQQVDMGPSKRGKGKQLSSQGPDRDHSPDPGPAIDYGKLVDAILRRQPTPTAQPTVPATSQSSNCHTRGSVTQGPSTSNAEDMTDPEMPDTRPSDFGEFLNNLFAGESMAHPEQQQMPLSLDKGIPLGAHLPIKTKQKIWANKFIDLKILVPSFTESDISVRLDEHSLQLSNAPATQSTLPLSQWTQAFYIFMAIFIEKFPEEAPHLLKYAYTIRD